MADLFKFLYGKPCRINCSNGGLLQQLFLVGIIQSDIHLLNMINRCGNLGNHAVGIVIVRCHQHNIAMADITGFQHIHIRSIPFDFKALKAVRKTPEGTFLFIYHQYIIPRLTQCRSQAGSKSSTACNQHLLIS